mmetsp:Transcript_29314/g.71376  ORF Transcript_29314/g.71376 Transcript_29314/m.71376 type:complete len:109 (+) Transcript_29314:132-458(+)
MRRRIVGVLCGGVLGGAGYFQLHQEVHHRYEAIERKLDALRGDAAVAKKRFSQMERETLEEYVRRSAARQWNEGIDVVYDKLLRLPDTVNKLYEDAMQKWKEYQSSQK